MLLRQLIPSDAERMLSWMHDREVMQWLAFDGASKSIEDCRRFISDSKDCSRNLHLAVSDESNQYCGTVSLKNIDMNSNEAEFAISICRDSQGKGYGSFAVREMLFHAFEILGLDRVYLTVLKENIHAIKVYERAGFRMTGEDEKRFHYEIHNNRKPRLIEFPQRGDLRGHLVIVEGGQSIPFDIKRCFYIYGSDADVVRGQHANRKSEFVLINVAGTSKVKTDDGRGNIRIYSLDRPHIGIYIPKMLWKDMYDFSPDSVLLCLSSEHYDAGEYIRDYDDFVRIVRNANV